MSPEYAGAGTLLGSPDEFLDWHLHGAALPLAPGATAGVEDVVDRVALGRAERVGLGASVLGGLGPLGAPVRTACVLPGA